MDLNKLNLKAVVISAVTLSVVPYLIVMLMQFVPSLYVGIQTRGNGDAVNAAAMAFWGSWFARITFWAAFGGLGFLRGKAMLKEAPGASLLNALVGVGIGAVANLVLFLWVLIVMQGIWPFMVCIVLALGGAYLGVTMGKK